MKSETKIAEENIEDYKYDKILNKFGKDKRKAVCKEHKASCQRFLEFLEELVRDIEGSEAIDRGFETPTPTELIHLKIDLIKPKITDLKNAIKKYDENGI